jgi:hypothetical protein
MAQLSEMLAQVRANEIAAAENALANQINAQLPQPPELDEHTKLLLAPFVQWCSSVGVRHVPAAPATCATYILNQAKVGVAPERIAAEAQAIEKLHDQCNLANPLQTRAARLALDQVLKIEPPRSWPKEEKAMFAHLPVQIRHIITARENDRERALRRAQNEYAEAKKRLRPARKGNYQWLGTVIGTVNKGLAPWAKTDYEKTIPDSAIPDRNPSARSLIQPQTKTTDLAASCRRTNKHDQAEKQTAEGGGRACGLAQGPARTSFRRRRSIYRDGRAKGKGRIAAPAPFVART